MKTNRLDFVQNINDESLIGQRLRFVDLYMTSMFLNKAFRRIVEQEEHMPRG